MNREIKIFGNVLKFDLRSDADESVFEEIFVDRDYKVVDEIIRRAAVVLDVGAHIGCFSAYCMALNSQSKIFSYEPAPENFSALKENLKVNRFNNVSCKNVAIGADSCVKEFHLSEDSHNHSFFGEGDIIKVQCIGVKDLLSRFEKVDLLKMDCEGAEFEILDAMGEAEFAKVRAFYIEYHEFEDGMRASRLVEILKRNGFRVDVKKSHYDARMGFVFGFK